MTVPLLRSDWLPGVHALDLQLSGRAERYQVETGTPGEQRRPNLSPPAVTYFAPTLNGQPLRTKDRYSSNNYTAGLRYQPLQGITVRLSRATAFVPPTPAQLAENPLPSTNTTEVFDPVLGRSTAVYTRSGGNASLRPQNSESTNLGVIWQPGGQALDGLRLNVEYYRVAQFDYITSLTPTQIVAQESRYPNRVTRDSTRMITVVDVSLLNLFRLETEGWDFSADYMRKTSFGTFHLRGLQSIVSHLKTQYAQNLPEYDAVGFPSEGGAAKYKSNLTLNWDWRRWSAGWSTRYYSGYNQYGSKGGPAWTQNANLGTFLDTSYLLPQGGTQIASQIYHDLFLGYDFGKRMWRGSTFQAFGESILSDLSLQAGVRNVFNRIPPLDVYYGSNTFFSPYGDIRMRTYWISLRKLF